MNTKLLIGLSIVGGLLMGGCQKPAGPVGSAGPAKPDQVQQSVAPTNPSAKPVAKSDTDEVKAIENDLNSIDASKDFPDFSVSDLQQ